MTPLQFAQFITAETAKLGKIVVDANVTARTDANSRGSAMSGADAAKEFAPTGRLRAAINFGNSVLAQKDPDTGGPRGLSVDIAHELARKTGVALDLVTFDAAEKVFAALKTSAWDVAFLAIAY